MNIDEEYRSKRQTAEKAIQLVPSVGNLSMGIAASNPPALLSALEKRIQSKDIDALRLYYMISGENAHKTILKYEHMDRLHPYCFFMGKCERELAQRAQTEGRHVVNYIPGNFSDIPEIIKDHIDIDAFILMVSPMDKAGYFSCGTNGDYTIPTARFAKKLIIEVNPNMPRVFGDCAIHLSEVSAIVEHESPLIEFPTHAANEIDKKISEIIIEMVPNRATLQFGLGALPDSICDALRSHKDLGVHSELMGIGLSKLIRSGAVSNKYKYINKHKNVYTLALGNSEMYAFLDNNSSMECYPVTYTNNPYIIGQNDNVISINSFVEIDLLGQVNAECINGKQFSAPGGQLDFVRGAQISKGGKSILTAYSTANQGRYSRIVPKLHGAVTDCRTETQYIVTEHGGVNLRGKSVRERAESLISIADPQFQEQLMRDAKMLGFL